MARVNLSRVAKVAAAQRAAVPIVNRTVHQVLTGAKQLAPRGDHMSGSGRRRRGKPLLEHMYATVSVTTTFARGRVGNRARYALTAHQGSSPHAIVGKKRMLKFRWDKGSALLRVRRGKARAFFFFRKVNHPGNKHPVRYLTIPLGMYGRRNGFKVSTIAAGRSRLP